jgi:hypothetical protein
MIRPPDTNCATATCSATSTGWYSGRITMFVPSRMRDVRAATAQSTISGCGR